MIDTEPIQKKKKKKIGLTLKEKRKKLLESTPKCFASLINESKVQDPISKRNRVRTKEERKHFIAKSIEEANEAKGIVKKKVLQSLGDRARSLKEAEAKRKVSKVKTFDKDIWETGTPFEQRTDFKNDWIDKHVTTHNIVNTGTPVVSVPTSAFHKRSKLKYVQDQFLNFDSILNMFSFYLQSYSNTTSRYELQSNVERSSSIISSC